MGEEFAAATPFLYFCDFAGELAQAVSEGRRAGFARYGRSADRQTRRCLPDPNAPESFARSKLDWDSRRRGDHASRLALYRELLRLRQEKLVPRLRGVAGEAAEFRVLGDTGFQVSWRLADGSQLQLVTNLGKRPLTVPDWEPPCGNILYALPAEFAEALAANRLPPWSVGVFLG
jgi:1,4-alpha-glucan branching enzyme